MTSELRRGSMWVFTVSLLLSVAVLVPVAVGWHYSSVLAENWFRQDKFDEHQAAAEIRPARGAVIAAACWPVLHMLAHLAVRLSNRKRCYQGAKVLVIVHLLTAPLLIYYAWLAVAGVLVGSVG